MSSSSLWPTRHRALPAVMGTLRDMAPSTQLWGQTLTYFHAGDQRITQR